jgi:hypothetical protein
MEVNAIDLLRRNAFCHRNQEEEKEQAFHIARFCKNPTTKWYPVVMDCCLTEPWKGQPYVWDTGIIT